jgi:hypothetical protein
LEERSAAKKACQPLTAEQAEEITDYFVKFLAEDFRPFSLANGKGFLRFMNKVRPEYKVPCGETLRNKTALLHAAVVDKVKTELAGVYAVSLTMDGWTSRAGRHYMGYTAHYLTEDFELRSLVLGVKLSRGSQTAERIRDGLLGVLQEFEIPLFKVSAVVTDGGGNMVKAVKLAGLQRVGCAAHRLQLAIRAGLEQKVLCSFVCRGRRRAHMWSCTGGERGGSKGAQDGLLHQIQRRQSPQLRGAAADRVF